MLAALAESGTALDDTARDKVVRQLTARRRELEGG